MKNYVTVAAALLLAAPGAAMAGVPKLSKLDADRDGKISRIEAAKSPELQTVFNRANANGDAYLDAAEFKKARELIREWNRGQDREQDRGHQPRTH